MNFKVKLIISVLLFLAAFFIRYGSSLDVVSLPGRQTLTYQTLGTGGDPDYQMYCARMYSTVGSDEAILHYDYFFLCPYMAVVVANVPFIVAFEVFAFINMFIGSLAVILPFVLFSSIKRFDIGGLFTSFLLLINPIMIYNSDGRYYIYPLVVLFFTIFSFLFIKALYSRTPIWLFALGSMAIIQGISKPFLYVNDIVLFILFPFLFCLSEIKFLNTFPYIQLTFDWKQFKAGLIPPVIYFIGIIGYEVIHYSFTGGIFFLSDLFLPIGPSLKDEVLGTSLHYAGGTIQKYENILSLLLYATKTFLSYLYYPFIVLFAVVISLIFTGKNPKNWALISLAAVACISLAIYFVTHQFLFPNIYVAIPPFTIFDTTTFALFYWLLIFISLRTQKGLALVCLHAFYFGALAMTLASVNQPQLFVTIIFWFALLLGYAFNSIWPRVLVQMTSRTYITALVIVMLFFILPVAKLLVASTTFIQKTNQEKEYLTWVKTVVSENDLIFGGMDDSLPLISRYSERTVVYNAIYVAFFIPPRAKSTEIYRVPDLAKYIEEAVASESGKKIYFLDNNTTFWNQYLEKGGSSNYPANKYSLVEVAHSTELNRKIYQLTKKYGQDVE